MCLFLSFHNSLLFSRLAFVAAEPLVDAAQTAMNFGLLNFAVGEFDKAIEFFDRVLASGSSKHLTAATNNRAVCLLFTCNLSGAVSALETPLLSSHPETFLDEVLVFNLNTLTDLHSERPQDKKTQINRVITTHADDAFDTAVVSSAQ